MPQTTPATNVHFSLSELGTSKYQDEGVLDLTRLTYDQFTHKIRQEKRRCLAWNPIAPLTATIEKDIVFDTRINLVMISLAGTTFVVAIEENVRKMSREILSL